MLPETKETNRPFQTASSPDSPERLKITHGLRISNLFASESVEDSEIRLTSSYGESTIISMGFCTSQVVIAGCFFHQQSLGIQSPSENGH